MAALPAPGPYRLQTVRECEVDCSAIIDRRGKTVAYYEWWEHHETTSEQTLSNLKLLTAAPELLYALIYLSEECSRLPWSLLTGGIFEALRASRKIISRLFGDRSKTLYQAFRRDSETQCP
jgi:hypothetical protein